MRVRFPCNGIPNRIFPPNWHCLAGRRSLTREMISNHGNIKDLAQCSPALLSRHVVPTLRGRQVAALEALSSQGPEAEGEGAGEGEALEAELRALKLSVLGKRARATEGIDEGAVDAALDDDDDPKAALIRVMLARAAVSMQGEACAATTRKARKTKRLAILDVFALAVFRLSLGRASV